MSNFPAGSDRTGDPSPGPSDWGSAEATRPLPVVPANASPDSTLTLPAFTDTAEVVDLALGFGEIHLSAGAAAYDVGVIIERVLAAYGLVGSSIDVTYASLTVSVRPAPKMRNETQVRVVVRRSQDYTRLVDTEALLTDIETGGVGVRDAAARLDDIIRAHHPFRHWMTVPAWGAIAAGVAVTAGASWGGASVAFLLAALTRLVTDVVAGRRLPVFLSQMGGAVLAVLVAAVAHQAGVSGRPGVIVVSGIVVLLSGMTFVGAVADALNGFYVTASARLLEVAVLTGGVIAGVHLGLEVLRKIEMPMTVATTLDRAVPVPVAVVASGVTAAAFAYSAYAPKISLPAVAVTGAVGQWAWIQVSAWGWSGVFASAFAAFVVGLMAYGMAPWVRSPGLLTAASGLIPLLPGVAIFRGLYQLSEAASTQALVTLLTAATLGAALAGGVLLGERAAHPFLRRFAPAEAPLARAERWRQRKRL